MVLILRPLSLVGLGIAVFVLASCREVPFAPTVTPPTPARYATVTLDTLRGANLDVNDQWAGVTMLLAPDQSAHVVAFDQWNGNLRYHGCANVCDDPAHWFAGTGDGGVTQWYYTVAGSVLTPGGIQSVYLVNVGNNFGIRYAHCAGACNLAGNWAMANLFLGESNFEGQPWVHSAPLATDPSGGLHLLFRSTQDGALHHAFCGAGCDNPGNWQDTPIDSAFADWQSAQLLAIAPGGGVHALYATGRLMHASCGSGCTVAANWRTDTVPVDSLSGKLAGLSVAFGTDGALHLAYVDGSSRPVYATCNAPCTVPETWTAVVLPLATRDVSLATDARGRLYLATAGRSVAVSRCDANCLDPASWQTTQVDSALGGGHVSIAVDSAGYARVASTFGGWPQILQYTRMLQ